MRLHKSDIIDVKEYRRMQKLAIEPINIGMYEIFIDRIDETNANECGLYGK